MDFIFSIICSEGGKELAADGNKIVHFNWIWPEKFIPSFRDTRFPILDVYVKYTT